MNESRLPATGRVAIDYRQALRAQDALVARRQAGELGDVLWLLEHPPTITLGTSSRGASDRGPGNSRDESAEVPVARDRAAEHVVASEAELASRGVALVPTRRGGDVTCHEPGQLVGYPIVDLGAIDSDRDLHLYLRRLEDALIAVLAGYGLVADRIEGRTGVWLEAPARKIAAMGVRVRRWVTSHGFALNFENDLAGFRDIVPCGIADAGVTSLREELTAARLPSHAQLVEAVHRELERALGRELRLLVGEEGLRVAGSAS